MQTMTTRFHLPASLLGRSRLYTNIGYVPGVLAIVFDWVSSVGTIISGYNFGNHHICLILKPGGFFTYSYYHFGYSLKIIASAYLCLLFFFLLGLLQRLFRYNNNNNTNKHLQHLHIILTGIFDDSMVLFLLRKDAFT